MLQCSLKYLQHPQTGTTTNVPHHWVICGAVTEWNARQHKDSTTAPRLCVDESQRHHAKWKSITQRNRHYDFKYINLRKRQIDLRWWASALWFAYGRGIGRHHEGFLSTDNVLYLALGIIFRVCSPWKSSSSSILKIWAHYCMYVILEWKK